MASLIFYGPNMDHVLNVDDLRSCVPVKGTENSMLQKKQMMLVFKDGTTQIIPSGLTDELLEALRKKGNKLSVLLLPHP